MFEFYNFIAKFCFIAKVWTNSLSAIIRRLKVGGIIIKVDNGH